MLGIDDICHEFLVPLSSQGPAGLRVKRHRRRNITTNTKRAWIIRGVASLHHWKPRLPIRAVIVYCSTVVTFLVLSQGLITTQLKRRSWHSAAINIAQPISPSVCRRSVCQTSSTERMASHQYKLCVFCVSVPLVGLCDAWKKVEVFSPRPSQQYDMFSPDDRPACKTSESLAW